MKFRRILCTLLAIIMLMCGLTACGTGASANPPTNAGNGENGHDPVEYTKLPETLPVIKIDTADGKDITGDERNQPYKDCTISVDGSENDFGDAAAKVRVRGNNTAGFDKKSFRIKFDSKQGFLGLNGGAKYKNWVLLACYKDISFLRDAIMFEFGKATLAANGYYCSDFTYAEVYINDSYNGLYLVAEQQQVNDGRIEINEPVSGYTGTDIGYLVEYDGNAVGYRTEDHYFSTQGADYGKLTCENGEQSFPIQWPGTPIRYTVKNDVYSTAQDSFIAAYIPNVYKIMYDAVYNDEYYKFNADYTAIERDSECKSSREAVENAVHLDSVVDMFLLQELGCDNDVDFSSFFMTVDMSANGSKKLAYTAPWDFDSGLGMMRGLEKRDTIFTVNRSTNAAKGLNPWLAVLWQADWFKQAVADRWAELTETNLFERINSLIDFVTEKYEPYFAKNYAKWDNLGKKTDPSVQSDTVERFKTHADSAEFLRDWVNHRVEFLTMYFADLYKNI